MDYYEAEGDHRGDLAKEDSKEGHENQSGQKVLEITLKESQGIFHEIVVCKSQDQKSQFVSPVWKSQVSFNVTP